MLSRFSFQMKEKYATPLQCSAPDEMLKKKKWAQEYYLLELNIFPH